MNRRKFLKAVMAASAMIALPVFSKNSLKKAYYPRYKPGKGSLQFLGKGDITFNIGGETVKAYRHRYNPGKGIVPIYYSTVLPSGITVDGITGMIV